LKGTSHRAHPRTQRPEDAEISGRAPANITPEPLTEPPYTAIARCSRLNRLTLDTGSGHHCAPKTWPITGLGRAGWYRARISHPERIRIAPETEKTVIGG